MEEYVLSIPVTFGRKNNPSEVYLFVEKDPRIKEHYMTPLGQLGTPEDTAYCAFYLASDESSWVTGQTFVLDGGQSIAG